MSSSQFQSVGIDSAFSLKEFKTRLGIRVRKYDNYDMEFEIEGISCSVRVLNDTFAYWMWYT